MGYWDKDLYVNKQLGDNLSTYMDKGFAVYRCPSEFQMPPPLDNQWDDRIHYGFNGRLQRFTAQDANKIVALDYACMLVNPYTGTPNELDARWNGESYTDSNGNGLWDTGESYTDTNSNGRRDPAGVRLRHFGRCNVLFGDGRVDRLDSELMDPTVCENVQNLWVPLLDARYLRCDPRQWLGPPIAEAPIDPGLTN